MQHSPKVLHVVISMNVGGAETLVSSMVKNELYRSNKPIVCCLENVGDLGEALVAEGYGVYAKQRSPGIDWSLINWLKNIMVVNQVSVVHAHQYTPLFYATIAALLAGRPKVIYTEHGRFYPDRKSWKRTIVNPLLALGVKHLVAISKATASAMNEYDNFPQGRINVIHNGIDFSRLNPVVDRNDLKREFDLPEKCTVLGTASRLNEIKNIDMMLRVFSDVRATFDDAYLVVAGDGPERERLEKLAGQLGVRDFIRFVGMRFDMPRIYSLFDVFLLTSFTEGISVTLLEALGSGVPAVVTNVGGNSELITEGVNGFLVPVDHDHIMVERIEQLLMDSLLRRQISQAAKINVHTEFTEDLMMTRYRDLYDN